MADGNYWGRGDTTKYKMADAEVRRHHERLGRRRDDLDADLDALIRADPVPNGLTANATGTGVHAHIHAIARPVTTRPELLIDAVTPTTWNTFFYSNIINGPPAAKLSAGWSPDLGSDASQLARRADGWAIHSYYMGADGSVPEKDKENHLLEFEVTENADVRLYCGRGSDTVKDTEVCLEVVTNGLAKRLVMVASELSRHVGFEGTWDFVYAITKLRGAVSYYRYQQFMADAIPFSDDQYRQRASATTIEMRDHTGQTAMRMVGRLNRALNDGEAAMP